MHVILNGAVTLTAKCSESNSSCTPESIEQGMSELILIDLRLIASIY